MFSSNRMVGMSSGQSLDSVVHSSLGASGQLASKAVETFGVAVENLLVKHGKKIVGKLWHSSVIRIRKAWIFENPETKYRYPVNNVENSRK